MFLLSYELHTASTTDNRMFDWNQGPDPVDFRFRTFHLDLPDLSSNQTVPLKQHLDSVMAERVDEPWAAETIVVSDISTTDPANLWVACLRGGGLCDVAFVESTGKKGIHVMYKNCQTQKK